MEPFDHYPRGGAVLLGRRTGDENCRHSYGLTLQQLTGQRDCAYCRISLVDDYSHWLLLCVDHVVPLSEAKRLGIDLGLAEDWINQVLACSGCNGFDNRYIIPDALMEALPESPLARFVLLRDRVFRDRAQRIALRRDQERAFFASKQWELAPRVRKVR